MTYYPLVVAIALGALLAFPTPTLAQTRAIPDAAGFIRITPDQVAWTAVPDSPGVKSATILGDPEKPGPYIVRYQFPPHVMDRPHSHSRDRYVTVLQGLWYTGTGPRFDAAKAIPLPPGSVMKHPSGGLHWDGSNSDETVIVQITGQGPVTTRQLDLKAPQWVRVKRIAGSPPPERTPAR
jgi:hypothetical protein